MVDYFNRAEDKTFQTTDQSTVFTVLIKINHNIHYATL